MKHEFERLESWLSVGRWDEFRDNCRSDGWELFRQNPDYNILLIKYANLVLKQTLEHSKEFEDTLCELLAFYSMRWISDLDIYNRTIGALITITKKNSFDRALGYAKLAPILDVSMEIFEEDRNFKKEIVVKRQLVSCELFAMYYSNAKIPSEYLFSLVNFLSKMYFYKADLIDFFDRIISDSGIRNCSYKPWDKTIKKVEIVKHFLAMLEEKQENISQWNLLFMVSTRSLNDVDLSRLDLVKDYPSLRSEAEMAKIQLNEIFNSLLDKVVQSRFCDKILASKLKKTEYSLEQNPVLMRLRLEFDRIAQLTSDQKRGREFNGFLAEMFATIDPDVKRSVYGSGEEVDVCFFHANRVFVVEAKWQKKEKVNSRVIMGHSGVINTRGDFATGLVISFHGFAPKVSREVNQGNSNLILLDGSHILAVLDGEITVQLLLESLIRLKSTRARVYFSMAEVKTAISHVSRKEIVA